MQDQNIQHQLATSLHKLNNVLDSSGRSDFSLGSPLAQPSRTNNISRNLLRRSVGPMPNKEPRQVMRRQTMIHAKPMMMSSFDNSTASLTRKSAAFTTPKSNLTRNPNVSMSFSNSPYEMYNTNFLSKAKKTDHYSNSFGLQIENEEVPDDDIFCNHIYKSFKDICSDDVRRANVTIGENESLDKITLFGDFCKQIIASMKEKQFSREGRNRAKYEVIFLEESSTWSLLVDLERDVDEYNQVQEEIDDEFIDIYSVNSTPRQIIDKLHKEDYYIRKDKIILEWLENYYNNEAKDGNAFVREKGAWENTLFKLKDNISIGYNAHNKMVSQMDPDACFVEKLLLDDLDQQDDQRIVKTVFNFIKCGKINEAENYLVRIGQAWRAASLQGHKIADDLNLSTPPANGQLINKTGNKLLSLWKSNAWNMSSNKNLNVYERAMFGSLCGHLDSLLNVCDNWRDHLWSYLKCNVNVKEQKYLFDCNDHILLCYRDSCLSLPEEFWKSENSLKTVFQKIGSSDKKIQREHKQPMHQIQRLLILENYEELVKLMADLSYSESKNLQLTRFMCHLVLYLSNKKDCSFQEIHGETVLKAYIDVLISAKETPDLIAYYCSKLLSESCTIVFSKYLEEVKLKCDREKAIEAAQQYDVDIRACLKNVVDTIRSYEDDEIQEDECVVSTQVSKVESNKIDCLQYLLLMEDQRIDALQYANALMREFIYKNKLELAQSVFDTIPVDSLDLIHSQFQLVTVTPSPSAMDVEDDEQDSVDNVVLPAHIDNAIKEYVCFDHLFKAMESHAEFYRSLVDKPIPLSNTITNRRQYLIQHKDEIVLNLDPETLKKKEYERKMADFNEKIIVDAKNTELAFQRVFKFPLGWMIDNKKLDITDEETLQRSSALKVIRQIYIPYLVKLLMGVYFESDQIHLQYEMVKMIIDSNYSLYKEFRREDIEKFIREFDSNTSAYRISADAPSQAPPQGSTPLNGRASFGSAVDPAHSRRFLAYLCGRLREHDVDFVMDDVEAARSHASTGEEGEAAGGSTIGSGNGQPTDGSQMGNVQNQVFLSDDEFISADEEV